MPRPPQPVLLPWLQPGGVEPPFQPPLCPIVKPREPLSKLAPPPRPPPFPLPCLAKAGAVRPTPITTLASSAAAAMPLAIAIPPGIICRLQNTADRWAVPFPEAAACGDAAG